jgi:hypothetical protein
MSVLCICGCIPRLFYQDGINYLGPVVSPLCFCGEVSNRPPRLCPIVYQRLRYLNLLKRQPTRRGKRRCKSRPLTSLGLVNACSVNKRHEAVSAHLLNFKLDLLAITETWQTSNDDSGLKLACPDGYSFIHTPRSGSVGGGVALIFKSTVAVQSVPVYLSLLLSNGSIFLSGFVTRDSGSSFSIVHQLHQRLHRFQFFSLSLPAY